MQSCVCVFLSGKFQLSQVGGQRTWAAFVMFVGPAKLCSTHRTICTNDRNGHTHTHTPYTELDNEFIRTSFFRTERTKFSFKNKLSNVHWPTTEMLPKTNFVFYFSRVVPLMLLFDSDTLLSFDIQLDSCEWCFRKILFFCQKLHACACAYKSIST